MNTQGCKAVLFDMDGTILDTSEDLANAVNYAMEQCGHRHDFTKEHGCLFFGSGVKVALRRALAYEKGYPREQILTIGQPDGLRLSTEDEALAEKLLTFYMPYYSAHNAVKTGPFPGICKTLGRLKEAGLRLAVVSNKPHDSVAALAEKYFPGLFELAIGEQNGIARKPAADMNLLALQRMGLKPEEAVYVGDTEIDLETARNSRMECIAVDWGFRGAEALKQLGAPVILHRPEELAEMLIEFKEASPMTECEKLDAGLEYDFWDDGVNARKAEAMVLCKKLNAQDPRDEGAIADTLRELFGSAGDSPWVGPNFQCDNGKNIHVGKHFIANFNVVILDIREVRIGDHCMIGPNTLITTVNHPLSPLKRRNHTGIAKPVIIGDDVWIGGNCTILPGVTIGNNVVIAAGAVVTKDVPDNCVAAGVPARVIKSIEDDVERSSPLAGEDSL